MKTIRRNAHKQIAALLALAAMVRKLNSGDEGVGERTATADEIRADLQAGKIKRIEQASDGDVHFIVNSALWYVLAKAAPQPAAEAPAAAVAAPVVNLPARAWFDRAGLLKSLRLAKLAVGKFGNLKSVKLELGLEKSFLTATDFAAVTVRLPIHGVMVQTPGTAIIDCAAAVSLLGKLKDRDVTLEAEEGEAGGAVVRTDAREISLPGTKEFVEVEAFEPMAVGHRIAAGPLRTLMGRTMFAAATESARYAMTGVMWDMSGWQARLVATDGRRLSVAECHAEPFGGMGVELTPVVPTKAMKLLAELLKGCDDDVLVSAAFTPTNGRIQVKGAEIRVKLVEGRFPPYKEVIPKKPPYAAGLTAGELLGLCEEAAGATDDESRGVDFVLDDDKLTLRCSSPAGKYQGGMPAVWPHKPLTITFDPKLVAQYLKSLDRKADVGLHLVDGSTAAVFKSGVGYQHVIMPLMRDRR